MARAGEKVRDLEAHQPAADDHGGALRHRDASLEHVHGHERALVRKAQRQRLCAVGDDELVKLLGRERLGRERRVEAHLDAQAFDLLALGARGSGHLGLARRHARCHELSAQAIGGLEYHRLVSPQLKRLGGDEACHARADHGDALGSRGGDERPVGLVPECGVAQARDGLEVLHVRKAVQAALVAAHAVDDVVDAALARLGHEVRVGELGTAHDHEVDLVLREDVLGELRGVDAPDADGGHAGLAADAGGVVDVEGGRQVDRRDLVGVGGRDDVAARDVEHVHSGLGCPAAELDGVLDGHAALEEVVVRVDAHEQGHVVTDGRADGADAGQREAGAVLQAAAVLVRAVVDAAGEEGVRQVVVRAVELHAVVASLAGAAGGLAEAGHDLVDLLMGDGRQREARGKRQVGGDEHLRGAVHANGDRALPELHARRAARSVNGIDETAVPLDVAVLGEGDEHARGARRVHARDLDDVEGTSGLGACHVIVDEPLRDEAVLAEARPHGGHDDAVLELEAANLERAEQVVEHRILLSRPAAPAYGRIVPPVAADAPRPRSTGRRKSAKGHL